MEFLSKLIEILAAIWPLVTINTYQRGGYFLLGHYEAELEPGIYWRTPFFEQIIEVNIAPAIASTPRLDLTLRDGSLFSCAISGWCQVLDVEKAVNKVDQFTESATEALAAVCAERLADVDIERFLPINRKRLLTDLKRWVNEETLEFGVEFTKLRFISYVPKPRNLRLMQDISGMAW